MAGDEPRTVFDPAYRKPSNPAEESGSPPPSGKSQIGESRGEAAWQHRHQWREWFAHIDDRFEDIMMSSLGNGVILAGILTDHPFPDYTRNLPAPVEFGSLEEFCKC